MSLSLSRHSIKQLQFLVPGLAITYYLETFTHLWTLRTCLIGDVYRRSAARTSLVSGALTIGLFLYILLIPWIKGQQPNYRSWRESGELSKVIPLLTACMVIGWPLLSFTLGHWSSLGYLEGIVGATGMYALIFGVLGLIPAPRYHRQ
ncbi:hypothetical protein JAAARDRAFT_127764 [Jaapia argillacea MUCL 33604]|uniref:Uncharacterized protein n=1 Tax=Jaapia argillacea MUCL 33604 TaxID=933084 RepID=A0A067Q6Y2_9AGAM|nr:hypothetical protein JAAARDRAFT_127764 [Jaapia argillacea MUCL 33604]